MAETDSGILQRSLAPLYPAAAAAAAAAARASLSVRPPVCHRDCMGDPTFLFLAKNGGGTVAEGPDSVMEPVVSGFGVLHFPEDQMRTDYGQPHSGRGRRRRRRRRATERS